MKRLLLTLRLRAARALFGLAMRVTPEEAKTRRNDAKEQAPAKTGCQVPVTTALEPVLLPPSGRVILRRAELFGVKGTRIYVFRPGDSGPWMAVHWTTGHPDEWSDEAKAKIARDINVTPEALQEAVKAA